MENRVIPIEYIPTFVLEVKQLISSGISLYEAIDILREDEKDEKIKKELDKLYDSLSNGDNLRESLSKTTFPKYMIDMMSLADETGKLEDTLSSLQTYYERQINLSRSLKNAITTPLILLVVMISIVVILITQVLPIFNKAFNQLGAQMGRIATIMMNLGFLLSNFSTILIVLLIGLVGCALFVVFNSKFRESCKFKILNKYGGKGLLREISISKFTYSMSMGVSTGMMLDEAIEKASIACEDNIQIKAKLDNCKTEIEQGKNIFESLSDNDIFSVRDSKLIKIAEQTGNIQETLETISRNQENYTINELTKLVNKIEPTIILISCVLTGLILLSIMLPLLGVISGL